MEDLAWKMEKIFFDQPPKIFCDIIGHYSDGTNNFFFYRRKIKKSTKRSAGYEFWGTVYTSRFNKPGTVLEPDYDGACPVYPGDFRPSGV